MVIAGAAHTVVAGYWAKLLGKDRLYGKAGRLWGLFVRGGVGGGVGGGGGWWRYHSLKAHQHRKGHTVPKQVIMIAMSIQVATV